MKVYANGQGGKHRANDTEAARWRRTTKRVAQEIRRAHPKMYADCVLLHAEGETAHAYYVARSKEKTA